jgi:hypothetical protein
MGNKTMKNKGKNVTLNQLVAGSIPASPTIFYNRLASVAKVGLTLFLLSLTIFSAPLPSYAGDDCANNGNSAPPGGTTSSPN